MGIKIIKYPFTANSNMFTGHQGTSGGSRLKWPAVAVVAIASSFSTLDNTKNWWNAFADRFGLTVNALDSSDLSKQGDTAKPWWKRVLGGRQQRVEEPSLPPGVIKEILQKDEFARKIENGIVSRFETNQIAANFPIEDRNVECFFPKTNAFFFGVFDGHSGYHCSQALKDRLPEYVSLAVSKLQSKYNVGLCEVLGKNDYDLPKINLPKDFEKKQNHLGTGVKWFSRYLQSHDCKSETHEDLIKLAFLTLDRDICTEAIPEGIADETLLTGLSGSCAIASFIDGNDLYVANTGDCRAVIGKRNSSGNWITSQITQDQTVDNVSEVNRIYRDHPKENKTAIQHGRLLGQLQPLRAFGDVQYKWDRELHKNVLNIVYGRPVVPMASYVTPPYLTADPVVSHLRIQNEDKFLILATDGLWEKISSEKAVQLIGCYLDTMDQGNADQENGATKLIRYALGKGSDAHLANLLTLPQNFKRNFHDDITVTVIYFNSEKVNSKL